MAGIEDYIAARAAYVKAVEALEQMRQALVAIASELGKRDSRFSFANTSIGLPMEYLNGPSMAAEQFPTAQTIQQAIANRASARNSMMNAWHALSQDARSALQSPPT